MKALAHWIAIDAAEDTSCRVSRFSAQWHLEEEVPELDADAFFDAENPLDDALYLAAKARRSSAKRR